MFIYFGHSLIPLILEKAFYLPFQCFHLSSVRETYPCLSLLSCTLGKDTATVDGSCPNLYGKATLNPGPPFCL